MDTLKTLWTSKSSEPVDGASRSKTNKRKSSATAVEADAKPQYNTKTGIRAIPSFLRSSKESHSSGRGDTASPGDRSSLTSMDGKYPRSFSFSSLPSSLGISDGAEKGNDSDDPDDDARASLGMSDNTLYDIITGRPWDSPDTAAIPDEYKVALTSAMQVLAGVMMQCEDEVMLSEAAQVGFLIRDLYNETADQPTNPSSKQKIDEFITLVNDLLRLIESFMPCPAIPPRPVPIGPIISTTGSTSSACTSPILTTLNTFDDPHSFAEIEDSLGLAVLEKFRRQMDKIVINQTAAIYYVHRPVYILASGEVSVNTDQFKAPPPNRKPGLLSFLRREKREKRWMDDSIRKAKQLLVFNRQRTREKVEVGDHQVRSDI